MAAKTQPFSIGAVVDEQDLEPELRTHTLETPQQQRYVVALIERRYDDNQVDVGRLAGTPALPDLLSRLANVTTAP